MTTANIYQDIAKRTGGDIYIGVVGPVRTGKSTFIKRFMDTLVLPNIDSEYSRERAKDELPQSAAGRTIMTTEPKFIPEDAVKISLGDSSSFRIRMIDCVGYIVPSSLGYIENDQPRMVMTPWFDTEIPFNMAAEIGTKKVITEHSTIGLVITTDGSISDIPREEYEEAEERVIEELKEIEKPFIVLMNCTEPGSMQARQMAERLQQKYQVTVLPVNCMQLGEEEIREILARVLFEFPVKEIRLFMPQWVTDLKKEHWLRASVFQNIQEAAGKIERVHQVKRLAEALESSPYVDRAKVTEMDLGTGSAQVEMRLKHDLFYKILGEQTGLEIENETGLLNCMRMLNTIRKKYDRISDAMEEVAQTGYGIVMPSLEELSLEEPEIMKQGGKYGIRLRAEAPSIHMMRANITTEVSPTMGSEKQSEEMFHYLLQEFEENPAKIWDSNIFGKSLYELVNEGLHNKLYRMPEEARMRIKETLERIINEGCNGLICLIL